MPCGEDSDYDIMGKFSLCESVTLFHSLMDTPESDPDTRRPYDAIIFAMIPTVNPWELAAWIPMGGWNECPTPEEQVAVVHMSVGAPVAVGMIEELHALGCNKFIACGGCGVLVDSLPVGNLLIPVSAVRDGGASYHYWPPSREVFPMNMRYTALRKRLAGKASTIPK